MPIIEDISEIEEPLEFKDIKTIKTTEKHDLLSLTFEDVDSEKLPIISVSQSTTKTTPISQEKHEKVKQGRSIEVVELESNQKHISETESDIISELRTRPTPTRFIELINQYETNNKSKSNITPEYLNLLTTVLIINLPDLYTQLSQNELAIVHKLYTSLTGVSSILSQIKVYLQQFLLEDNSKDGTNNVKMGPETPSSFLIDPMKRKNEEEFSKNEIKATATTYTKVTETLQITYQQISLLLNLLAKLLKQPHSVVKIFSKTQKELHQGRRKTALREINAYIAGSRIYSLAAQCHNSFKNHPLIHDSEDTTNTKWEWMADPTKYERFLGLSLKDILLTLSRSDFSPEFLLALEPEVLPDFTMKTLRLHGSLNNNEALLEILNPNDPSIANLFSENILKHMRPLDFRSVFSTFIIPYIYKKYLCSANFMLQDEENLAYSKATIKSCAELIIHLINTSLSQNENRKSIIELLSSQFSEIATSPVYSLALRRVISLVISNIYSKDIREAEYNQYSELIATWGNSLNVRHTPIAAQQAQSEFVLLRALQITKQKDSFKGKKSNEEGKHFLKTKILNSQSYLNAISSRLESNSIQPRIFGMAIAESLSKLLDTEGKILDFHMDDLYGQDLDYYKKFIVGLNDEINYEDEKDTSAMEWWKGLQGYSPKKQKSTINKGDKPTRKGKSEIQEETVHKPDSQSISKVVDDSDDEFQPMSFENEENIDSDLDEEDLDDPSLNVLDKDKRKLKPPVYIKDLLQYLNDTESYDKQKLALETAATLIQKKAQYGQEVKFYGKELAGLLVGLRDTFEIKDFDKLREEALAVLVAYAPLVVAPHLSLLLVTGDYSLMQRAVILASLVSGSRILATIGPNQKDALSSVFASKQLPSASLHEKFLAMDKLYGNYNDGVSSQKDRETGAYNFSQLKSVTYEMQQELLGGTTERAQEQLVGSAKILRVSGSLEKKRKEKQNGNDNGLKSKIPKQNMYSKIASRTFFMPLVSQWYRIAGSTSIRNKSGLYHGNFVTQFLNTLAILLYLAAPSSTDLFEMSGTLLEIVMEQRSTGNNGNNSSSSYFEELSAREGLYTAILAIVQVNNEKDGGETLVTRWPREIVELKLWAEDMWNSYDKYEHSFSSQSTASSSSSSPTLNTASATAAADFETKRVRGLAANILFLLNEIVNKWQRRLIGEVMGIENEGYGDRGFNGDDNISTGVRSLPKLRGLNGL